MSPDAPVAIDRRFCGPPTSGNGGYTAGLLARAMGIGEGDAVEVRLRVPPPLDRALRTAPGTDGATLLLDGEGETATVVAEGRRIDDVELDAPAPVPAEVADAAEPFDPADHPFPTCFACGPAREPGDGLRLFARAVPGRDVFACTWVPDASVADDDGTVPAEIVFAALDCPGGQAVSVFGADDVAVLLGTIQVRHTGAVRTGERYVLTSWRISTEGRKHTTGVTLTDAAGRELGRSRAVWFAVAADR